jgi:long-subunit fatty acid transport protein
MRKLGSIYLLAAILISPLLLTAEAEADIGVGISLEKLGILTTPGAGARPHGMGLAYSSVSDDAFALLYNPAGLAQVSINELSMGFHHTSRDVTSGYEALESTQSGSYTSFSNLAFAYPYPAYRGSLVMSFGAFRVGGSDLDTYKSGYLSDIPATSENSYTQSGNIYQYHFGIGAEVTPNISLGASLVLWDESVDFTDQITYEDAGSLAVYTDAVSIDLDGFSFNVGMLLRFNDILRAGFMFSSPAWLNYEGTGYITYDGIYYEGPYIDWTYDETGLIDEDYTLPMRFRGGASAQLAPLLVSFDLEYIDYSQIKYNGKRLIDDLSPGRPPVFDSVWNIFVGAEITLPNFPVSLRGGYNYMPLAMPMMEEIVFIEDDMLVSYIGDARIIRERQNYSFGAGVIIDETLAIDAAMSFGSFERETEYSVDKQETMEFIMTGTYMF